jgi:hypothetical protein
VLVENWDGCTYNVLIEGLFGPNVDRIGFVDQVCVCVCMCVCVCVYVCVYVCMYVSIYLYIYVPIYVYYSY